MPAEPTDPPVQALTAVPDRAEDEVDRVLAVPTRAGIYRRLRT